MPRREPADHELIWRTVDALGNAREASRQLGLHENTVYASLRRRRGVCVRCGGPKKSIVLKHCDKCLIALAASVKAKRAERLRLGLCQQCDRTVDPPSRTVCAEHRLVHIRDNRAWEKRRRPVQGGTPRESTRRKNIKFKYGQAGLDVIDRDGNRCVICGSPHAEGVVHIHHIDGDDTHSTTENMACLCQRCHRLFHLAVDHPDIIGFLEWVRNHRPDFKG